MFPESRCPCFKGGPYYSNLGEGHPLVENTQVGTA